MGSIFGLPLRADDAPSVGADHRNATTAAHEQPVPASETSSAFRFTDTSDQTGGWKPHPAANVLRLGNSEAGAEDAAGSNRSDTTPGIRFEGEPVPPRTVDGDNLLRPMAEPSAAPATTPLRFLDKRPSLVLRRTKAGHLTLGNVAGRSSGVTAQNASDNVPGFSFTDKRHPPQADPVRNSSALEPIPARHPLLVVDPQVLRNGAMPTSLSGRGRSASAAPNHPLLVGQDASAGQDSVLMTIRRRKLDDASTSSTAEATPAGPGAPPVPTRASASASSGGTAPLPLRTASPTTPSSVGGPRTAGIARVASPQFDRSNQSTETVQVTDSRGPGEMHNSALSKATAGPRRNGVETTLSGRTWEQVPPVETPSPQSHSFMSEGLRKFDRTESEPAPVSHEPVSHEDAWWATVKTPASAQHSAGQAHPARAAVHSTTSEGNGAEDWLLPVAGAVGAESPPSAKVPRATQASAPEEPAWLNPSPESVPVSLSLDASYSGAVKPSGAEAVPEAGDAYTMGPGRASRRLPAVARDLAATEQPQWAAPHSSGSQATDGGIRTSSIELAALLNDLEPLEPGVPALPAAGAATSPTAADFPSTSAETSDTSAPGDAAGPDSSAGGVNVAEQTLGEAPEETDEPLQFLRRQTVLLEPGEHQFDVGISYLNDMSEFPVLLTDGTDFAVARGQTRQRLLSVPLELRVGIAPYTQAFVNVPFGWSNSEVSFNGNEFIEDEGGIGDVSAGVTKQIIMGNQYYPDVLASLAFSAPTGDSSITTALGTPGSSLGQGFWTLTGGLSFIQTYDPLVLFYGLGYTFRFQNEFGDNIEIEPGDQVFYRFGAGFAVNPHITLSAAFTGSVIGRDKVDGIEIGGSVREPMSVRLAATISRRKGSKTHSSFKLVEPYVNFGLNEDSIDTIIGISWTH